MIEFRQPTSNLDELYQAAEAAQPEFFYLVKRVAQATGGQAITPQLKSRERAEVKIAADYEGRAEEIRDLLRASIHYKSLKQVYQGLEQLQEEGIEVLFIKDRFSNPTPSGYRDALVNIRTSNGVIAELQLHLEQILVAKQEGHKYYKQEQEFNRRAKLENRKLTLEERNQTEVNQAKQKELYQAAFLQAQAGERVQNWGQFQKPSVQGRETELAGKQQALKVAKTLSLLLTRTGLGELQTDNSLVYQGKNYECCQKQSTISLLAKDGRGEILRVTDGKPVVNTMTSQDIEKCYKLQQIIEKALPKQSDNELTL